MTAFDHFQIATCQIAEGDRRAAIASLTAAITEIDRTGDDAAMREDLVSLWLAVTTAAEQE